VAPLALCGLVVVSFIIDLVLPGNFSNLGIRPRRLIGLLGIATSPFLHAGWSHLIANIIPLFVMGCMINALNQKHFLMRTVSLIVLSGSFTWLLSSAGLVIGASGLVFAYWSFLIVNGVRGRTLLSVFFAVITVLVYGALLFSLFRYIPGVSWAGHLSGAIAGVVVAMLSPRRQSIS